MSNQKKLSQPENPLLSAYSDLISRRRFIGATSGDIEDIGQEAFLRVLETDNSSSIRSPMRYLMRIARNIFIDRQRRRAREATIHNSLELTETDPRDQPNPERIILARQELERVAIAISLLPPRCRQAFVLHRFQDLSYSAIARRMGISAGTVEKHIAEAMLRITRAVHETDEAADGQL